VSVAAAPVRATIDGLLLIAIGEAVLIGIAYAVTGVPRLVTLGVLSAIPFASPPTFVGASAWRSRNSRPSRRSVFSVRIGVVFVADHFVLLMLIGGTIRLPFL
jgi:predicted PurR-regulated permease PerM